MKLLNVPFTRLTLGDIPRPWLPLKITNPYSDKSIRIFGLIDTGADECAFPARYATLLGHNLESGFVKEINTGNRKTISYSHTVNIQIQGKIIKNVLIDFMPNLNVPLLGVKSFLSNFVLIVDYPKRRFSLGR